MIDLRKEVYYEPIDDSVVEIFDQYQWGLKNLGVSFSEEILETIVYYSFNLENSLIAFCAWILWKKEQGQGFDPDILNSILLESLRETWIPSQFQIKYLQENNHILKSPRDWIWQKAEEILGYQLRNRILSDITNTYQLSFMDNLELTPDEENKLNELQEYIRQVKKHSVI